jgi:hypothetical protein
MRLFFAATVTALSSLVPTLLPAQRNTGNDEVIRTLYLSDRFFAVGLTPRGDTMTLFLDTGDMSRVWEGTAERVGMLPKMVNTTRGAVRVAGLPTFRSGHGLPQPSLGLHQVIVTPPIDRFDTLMSTHTDGQLGTNWFAGRRWTLDYPAHRLVLHGARMPAAPAGAHQTPLGFPMDADGLRVANNAGFIVEIDGDSLYMLFDTGATVWLTDSALSAVNDGLPSERAISLAWGWLFNRWKERHPDWRVIPGADSMSKDALIEVPSVRVAGFDVGPVWFRSLSSANTPPPARPEGAPLLGSRVSGTIGGNVLRHFLIQLDYPRGLAWFVRKDH